MVGERERGRRRARIFGLIGGTAAVVAVLLSPFVLEAFGGSDARWGRLSQIGAAYGFTSALVAALALGGVAVSLAQANRQGKADQVQAIRGYYLDLVRIQLDDMATYQPCWGPTDLPDEQAMRRHVYCDVMMNYAWMGYQVGSIPDGLLDDMLRTMFSGEPGYDYWRRARTSWVAGGAEGRAGQRFLKIVEEAHSQARPAGSSDPSGPGGAIPGAPPTAHP